MSPVQIYFLLCFLLAANLHVSVGLTVYDVKLAKNCSQRYKNYFRNFSVVRVSRKLQYFQTEYVVTAPVTQFRNDWTVFKCEDQEGQNCKFFMKMRFPNGCELLVDQNRPWTTLYNSTEPRLACPLRKGVYKIKNSYLDTKFLDNYRLNSPVYLDGFWKVKILAIAAETMSCIEMVAKLDWV